MFQRHKPAFVLGGYLFVSFLLLSWSADRVVQSLKVAFFYLLNPVSSPLIEPLAQWGTVGENLYLLIHADRRAREAERRWLLGRLDEKRIASVEEENRRLTEFTGLSRWPYFRASPARVWARNPTDWFHSVIVRPSNVAECRTGDAAVSVVNGRVVVLGQVAEILPQGLARVLLLTDPSSAVSGLSARTNEQGLVEGRGINVLLFNYLFSDSEVRPGDEVVTAGLGEVFPAGLLVGTVLSVQEASHESFKRAVVSPAARLSNIEHLLLLTRREEGGDLR